MKALSIRQPWAWLIVRPDLDDEKRAFAYKHGHIKTIENRVWATRYRGPVLIHAAAGMTNAEYEDCKRYAAARMIELPTKQELQRGGVIGMARVVACVDATSMTAAHSRWFMGPFGHVLAEAKPMPFQPMKGRLGYFDVFQLENPLLHLELT